MTPRIIYRVLPLHDGGWKVEGRGHVVPGGINIQRFRRKIEAVATGRRLAQAHWVRAGVAAHLVIYRRDGTTIHAEYNFGRDHQGEALSCPT